MTRATRYRSNKKLKVVIDLFTDLPETDRSPEVLGALAAAAGVPDEVAKEHFKLALSIWTKPGKAAR